MKYEGPTPKGEILEDCPLCHKVINIRYMESHLDRHEKKHKPLFPIDTAEFRKKIREQIKNNKR